MKKWYISIFKIDTGYDYEKRKAMVFADSIEEAEYMISNRIRNIGNDYFVYSFIKTYEVNDECYIF